MDQIQLDNAGLRIFFLKHLNHLCSAKAHVLKRFPEIAAETHFPDLKYAIQETRDNVEKQVARMESIFLLLNDDLKVRGSDAMKGVFESAFAAIQLREPDPAQKDMSILFYMQLIEGIEMASFQVLQMTAVKLKNGDITQLLKENYDEAKEDRDLMLMIAAKYLTGIPHSKHVT